jgi:hypothetical protein
MPGSIAGGTHCTKIDCDEMGETLAKIKLYNINIDYEDLERTLVQSTGYYRNGL